MRVESAEELYEMVTHEVPVLEDFEDRFRREAAGYVEHEIGGPVEGIPRYVGEEVEEGSFEDTVDDAAFAIAFMRVRDDQLKSMMKGLNEVNRYRVIDDSGGSRGFEARKALEGGRMNLESVNSDLKAIARTLDELGEVPYNPRNRSRSLFVNRDGYPDGPKIVGDMDFQKAVEAYWPFDSELQ